MSRLTRKGLAASLPLAVLLLAGWLTAEEPKPSGRQIVLFNGKDLTGWVNVNGATATWSVRDGMLVGAGKPSGPRNARLTAASRASPLRGQRG